MPNEIILKCLKQRKNMANELIKHVTDSTFESVVIDSKDTVLVDFWAEWCGPCKMIAPVLDDAAAAYKDKLQITKMNVDDNRDIPAKFGIRGIPTLMLFKNGQLAATKVGAMSKAQLTEFLEQQLA
jgi:thioredoxin 1